MGFCSRLSGETMSLLQGCKVVEGVLFAGLGQVRLCGGAGMGQPVSCVCVLWRLVGWFVSFDCTTIFGVPHSIGKGLPRNLRS